MNKLLLSKSDLHGTLQQHTFHDHECKIKYLVVKLENFFCNEAYLSFFNVINAISGSLNDKNKTK